MKIKDISSISPQNTYQNEHYLHDIKNYFGNKLMAIEPDYSGLIAPSQLRRMGKALRMGIGCGLLLLRKHENIDGIIIGTSEGGLEDCIKFLNQIVDYDEGTLTPTNFVQSTPNALAGQLALITGNNGYNITHVNKGLAFENALIDAKMLFEQKDAKMLLVGGVEEISLYNYNIEFLSGHFKTIECDSSQLNSSNTEGTICGESASMFIVESNSQADDICVRNVETIAYPNSDDIRELLCRITNKNLGGIEEIDALIVGINGDIRTDFWYHDMVKSNFENKTIITYKNLVGEHPTSTAFALKLAHDIIKYQIVPEQILLKNSHKKIENVLIYNHFKGVQHSFIYVERQKG